jgi:hypothetical protein
MAHYMAVNLKYKIKNLQILISRKPHPRALLEMQNQNIQKGILLLVCRFC